MLCNRGVGVGGVGGECVGVGVCGGGIKLKVGFQPRLVLSPSASWIRMCMQVIRV